MKHTWKVEALHDGEWKKVIEASKQFCEGFLHARQYEAPRLAQRLIRDDGKVFYELPAKAEVFIGQVAGWPTAEQYERAVARALEKARAIRAKMS
jgi:hypothetical protein